jgi:hypothetical protein
MDLHSGATSDHEILRFAQDDDLPKMKKLTDVCAAKTVDV